MATFAYCRVSTMEQAEDGESLGIQQRQISGYCQMLGFDEPKTFIERGVSGSKPLNERLAGKELLETLQKGDVIVAAKLDRMFRSALDALKMAELIKQKGCSLHLIDLGGDVCGNGISKLFFTILSAVAEAERDRIRERAKDTKNDLRKRGRVLGAVPFGFKVVKDEDAVTGGILERDEAQQAAIIHMRALKAQGLSLRKIAAAIAEEGFKLSHEGVAQVLARE